jgi:hypothetical protein
MLIGMNMNIIAQTSFNSIASIIHLSLFADGKLAIGMAHFFTSLFRTTLAQIPPREILLLEEIPG